MKIAIVTPYYYPHLGGVTEHVYALYKHFKNNGLDVKIITSSFSSKDTSPNENDVIRIGKAISIYVNGSFGKITLPFFIVKKIKSVLEKEQFDIIHFHEPLVPTLPLTVLKYSKSCNIGTFHAYSKKNIAYKIFQSKMQKYYDKLDGKIMVSQAAGNFTSKYFKENYQIIPNGIDTCNFNAEISQIKEFKDNKLNILFVGRFDPRKGLRYLLQAFNIVKKSFPNVRLLIVGKGSFQKFYKNFIDEKVKNDIHFVGFQYENLAQYYSTCDIFCSPATGRESFGIILLEAMASSKPIVASNIPGYNEVVSDKEGLLVPPKNPKLLAESLIKLLQDKDLRIKMGNAGREKSLKYSWENISNQVLKYYQKILQQKKDIPL
ncbi:MAG: glycosyltransferase family 4 protein [bacterium]